MLFFKAPFYESCVSKKREKHVGLETTKGTTTCHMYLSYHLSYYNGKLQLQALIEPLCNGSIHMCMQYIYVCMYAIGICCDGST